MKLKLYALSFEAVADDSHVVAFVARTMAHTKCLAHNVPNLSTAKSVHMGEWTFTSKGFDCLWNTTCPFCGKQVTEGIELIVLYATIHMEE